MWAPCHNGAHTHLDYIWTSYIQLSTLGFGTVTIMSDEEETTTEKSNYSIEIPTFKEWSINKYYDHSNLAADFEDLEALNRQIAAARSSLF